MRVSCLYEQLYATQSFEVCLPVPIFGKANGQRSPTRVLFQKDHYLIGAVLQIPHAALHAWQVLWWRMLALLCKA